MKKIIFAVLLSGLVSPVFADAVFETITIPGTIVPLSKHYVIDEHANIMTPEQRKNPAGVDYDEYFNSNNMNVETGKVIDANLYTSVIDMLGKYPNYVKLIFSDIDGIVLPENYNGNTFSNSLLKAFQKLDDEDISFVLTTNRTFKEAKRMANALDVKPLYYVTEGGAQIVKPNGEVVYSNKVDYPFMKKINKEVKWFNYYYEQDLKIAFYQDGKVYTYVNTNIPNLLDVPEKIENFSQMPKLKGCSKIKIYAADAHTLVIFERYLKKYYSKYLDISLATSNSLDIVNKSATKADAAEIITDLINLDVSSTAAFGYSESDIGLMNYIRKNDGLAISNDGSCVQVKENSSYITKDVEHDGFAFAINTILGNNMLLGAERN